MKTYALLAALTALVAASFPYLPGPKAESRAAAAVRSERVVHLAGLTLRENRLGDERVTLANVAEFRTEAEVDAYIAARSAELGRLAAASPDRVISVQISPVAALPLESLERHLAGRGARLDALSLDVYTAGALSHTVAFDRTTKMLDVDAGPAAIARRVVEIECRAPRVAADGREHRLRPAATTVGLRFARARMSAGAAAALQLDPAIALVDPTADIVDLYAAEARRVVVTSMPQLFVERRDLARRAEIRKAGLPQQ